MGFISKLEIDEFFPELVLGVGRVAIEALARGANVISVNSKRMGHIVAPPNYNEYAINNFVHIHGMPSKSPFQNSKTSSKQALLSPTAPRLRKIRNDFSIRKLRKGSSDITSVFLFTTAFCYASNIVSFCSS